MTKYQLFEYHANIMLTHNLRVSDDRHFEKLFNHIENNKYILFNLIRMISK